MKLTILGAGAMGSWFGGRLAVAGHDVTLLTTNVAHCEAIARSGLTMREGDSEQIVQIKALHPEEYVGSADIIVLLTKTFQTENALTAISKTIDKETHVLTLQNGLGNVEKINRFIPMENILIGNSLMPVDKLAAGVIEKKGNGGNWFNALDERARSLCVDIENAFMEAGLNPVVDPAIHERIWSKVAFNSGMNAAAALAQGTPGTIGDSPNAQDLVIRAAEEVVSVAQAVGVTVDISQVVETIKYACSEHGDHKPSMLQDLLGAGRTEVDALNGEIVRLGREHEVATPVNDLLDTLVRLAELSRQRYR